MKRVIEHIRNKPEHTIHQIIWAITGVVVVFLIGFWILVGSSGQQKINSNLMDSVNKDFQAGRDMFKDQAPNKIIP